jgi:hypothetical protein
MIRKRVLLQETADARAVDFKRHHYPDVYRFRSLYGTDAGAGFLQVELGDESLHPDAAMAREDPCRLVKPARYYWLLLVESHLTRRLFAAWCGGSPRYR